MRTINPIEKIEGAVLWMLFEIQQEFHNEAEAAGEMHREMEEEWDVEQARECHGRREAFLQAGAAIEKRITALQAGDALKPSGFNSEANVKAQAPEPEEAR